MYTNRKKIKMQGKTKAHTKSIIKSQIIELIRAKKFKTTPAKAKIVKSVFDRVVTKQKKGNVNYVSAFFANNERSIKRFNDIVEMHLMDRNSGYTKVIKTLDRKGDGASQAYVMLVNTEVKEKKTAIEKKLESQEASKAKKKTKSTKVKSVKEEK